MRGGARLWAVGNLSGQRWLELSAVHACFTCRCPAKAPRGRWLRGLPHRHNPTLFTLPPLSCRYFELSVLLKTGETCLPFLPPFGLALLPRICPSLPRLRQKLYKESCLPASRPPGHTPLESWAATCCRTLASAAEPGRSSLLLLQAGR